jgi:hypothetical protein
MRRLFLAVGSVVGMLALGIAPAAAIPPDRVVDETYDPSVTEIDPFLTEECGFPVTSSSKGHFRVTVFLDKNGNFRREVAHPSFTNTLRSPYATLSTSDRGMDRITENPDGTLTIFGTGIHLKVKGGAHAIGLWVLVVNPLAGELLSEEYHGRFDVVAPEIVDYICARLAPA